MKIRAGDSVVVITGKDKGKTGTVLSVLQNTDRAVVGGINMRTRHIKATPQRAGQKLKYEASIHISNIMVVDPKTKKRARIGDKIDSKGKKIRIAKQSGEEIFAVKPKETKAIKGTKGTEATDETKEAKDGPKAAGRKPFWSRLGIGENEGDDAEVKESKTDHASSKDSTSQVRSSGRGS